MATEAQPMGGLQQVELSNELASQWRRLTRAATVVALLTAPAVVVWLNQTQSWSWFWSILAALALVVCFRGVIDILFHRMIPRPSLFGLESQQLREEDVVARRRVWFWRFWVKAAIVVAIILLPFYLFLDAALLVQIVPLLVILPFFLVMNFLILFGPLLIMNLSQNQGFEPGDAEWGVKLADVRGQAEAKESPAARSDSRANGAVSASSSSTRSTRSACAGRRSAPASEGPQAASIRLTCMTSCGTAPSERSIRPAISSSRTTAGATASSRSARRSPQALPLSRPG